MKPLLVIVPAFALTACAAPPLLQVASLALSGITYLETGKTISDHALSAMAQRDCQMFRAMSGGDFCVDYAAEPQIEVAAGDSEAGADPWVKTGASAAPAPAPASKPSEPAPQPIPVAASPSETPQVAGAKADASAPDASGRPATVALRYLVVGSFVTAAEAERHIVHLKRNGLRIVEATLQGRPQFRVVAGPFDQPAMAEAKRAFVAGGVKDAWIVMLDEEPAPLWVAQR